jgi:hypothetical protein
MFLGVRIHERAEPTCFPTLHPAFVEQPKAEVSFPGRGLSESSKQFLPVLILCFMRYD